LVVYAIESLPVSFSAADASGVVCRGGIAAIGELPDFPQLAGAALVLSLKIPAPF